MYLQSNGGIKSHCQILSHNFLRKHKLETNYNIINFGKIMIGDKIDFTQKPPQKTTMFISWCSAPVFSFLGTNTAFIQFLFGLFQKSQSNCLFSGKN